MASGSQTETPLTANIRPGREPLDLAGYRDAGGYRAVEHALDARPEAITELVEQSRLRGRGGAGFPTGLKWSFIPMGDDARPVKYLVCNADEMEPGTFKDRLLLEGDPHQMIEAMIVSAYAVQASVGYIFLRGEYTVAERRLKRAIAEAEEAGLLGENVLDSEFSFRVHLHTSAGRYICGEETAMLSALQGQRAVPRDKPPFPQAVGLFGRPTAINNVETLCNVPHIVNHGAEWFRDLSRVDDGGTKLYAASGRVRNPGVWELPLGTSLREILEEHAGGMQQGFGFKAVLPGGGSTPMLIEKHLDLPADFDAMEEAGSRLGTGALVVVDSHTSIVGLLRNLEHFFAQESCGWCTPCREGLSWIEKVLAEMERGRGRPGDIELLEQHVDMLGPGKTFCAHAPGAVGPLMTALEYFRDEFEAGIASTEGAA
ncbi:MAG: NADH-quinone oxidoreductase subunit NuoF [Candidatus Wenzhouxiangella sp. M2_3B_020]